MNEFDENKIDGLSNLLKEAKPLYKARKKRAKLAKLALLMCIPMFLSIELYNLYIQGEETYISLGENNLQIELTQDEFGLYR